MTAWREIRQQVLQRDRRTCQVCGKEHSGQVHHIIPRIDTPTAIKTSLRYTSGTLREHFDLKPWDSRFNVGSCSSRFSPT